MNEITNVIRFGNPVDLKRTILFLDPWLVKDQLAKNYFWHKRYVYFENDILLFFFTNLTFFFKEKKRKQNELQVARPLTDWDSPLHLLLWKTSPEYRNRFLYELNLGNTVYIRWRAIFLVFFGIGVAVPTLRQSEPKCGNVAIYIYLPVLFTQKQVTSTKTVMTNRAPRMTQTMMTVAGTNFSVDCSASSTASMPVLYHRLMLCLVWFFLCLFCFVLFCIHRGNARRTLYYYLSTP